MRRPIDFWLVRYVMPLRTCRRCRWYWSERNREVVTVCPCRHFPGLCSAHAMAAHPAPLGAARVVTRGGGIHVRAIQSNDLSAGQLRPFPHHLVEEEQHVPIPD